MPDSLSDLEQRREFLAQRIAELGDLRPGSITGTSGRCGKPECHCHQPGQPGHGPNFRLTYKVDGKTIVVSVGGKAREQTRAGELPRDQRKCTLREASLKTRRVVETRRVWFTCKFAGCLITSGRRSAGASGCRLSRGTAGTSCSECQGRSPSG